MGENLIIEGIMYYHPLLLVERLPVMIAFDDNNQVSQVSDEVEPLCVVSSFTSDQLYQRWVKAVNAFPFNEKRDRNTLMQLNESIGLDLLLFAIDMAERASNDGRSVVSPHRLEDYILEAGGILARRVSDFRSAGYFN